MGHNEAYHPTVGMARRKGWRVWADCRCSHAGPVDLTGLSDVLKMREVERRLLCTHCGARRCRLVIDDRSAERETEGQRADRTRAMSATMG